MAEFFSEVAFWHWLALGGILITIEILAPSTLLLWPGLGCIVVGLVLLGFPEIGWQIQIALFAVMSVASVLAWRSYMRLRPVAPEPRRLNQRARQYVGRHFTLDEPITQGVGKLRIDDTMWRVRGNDLDAGTEVEIVDTDGVVLVVERRA